MALVLMSYSCDDTLNQRTLGYVVACPANMNRHKLVLDVFSN
jgi:hypothetical protein